MLGYWIFQHSDTQLCQSISAAGLMLVMYWLCINIPHTSSCQRGKLTLCRLQADWGASWGFVHHWALTNVSRAFPSSSNICVLILVLFTWKHGRVYELTSVMCVMLLMQMHVFFNLYFRPHHFLHAPFTACVYTASLYSWADLALQWHINEGGCS